MAILLMHAHIKNQMTGILLMDHNDVMELLIDQSNDDASVPQCQIIKHSQMAAIV